MGRPVYKRALSRAVELYGVAAIAARIEQPVEQVQRWAEGREPIPGDVFLLVVDLLLEREVSSLSSRSAAPATPAGEPPQPGTS